jgi:hypothetical protein
LGIAAWWLMRKNRRQSSITESAVDRITPGSAEGDMETVDQDLLQKSGTL